MLPLAEKYDFNLLLPEFRGSNLNTNPNCTYACGSDFAKQDVKDAIDFVCDKDGKRIYIQVCYYLSSEKTEEREFGAYENIKDNYPKYVLSMDEFDMSRNGIIHMNIRDFLLNFKNS